jgi:predicted kinase
MHRGNIAYESGQILIFDGIEFNPDLRWIDTVSELAFLIMDLEEAGELPQARGLLNRYLELTGDYAGLRLLDFYKVYRAMVRAKVIAIRLGQSDVGPVEAEADRREYERYVDLAEVYTRPRPRTLYLTHGVSGSGKSRIAAALRLRLPLIHLRSDIERKRLFGLPADARTAPGGYGRGIYGPDAGRRTYARLRELAGVVLEGGCSPLVDATFLRQEQRAPFAVLAREKGARLVILELTAPEASLRARVRSREAEGRDPSEAGVDVLASQLANREPLTEAERRHAVPVDTASPSALEDLLACLNLETAVSC